MYATIRKICCLAILLFSLPCYAVNYIGIDYKYRRMAGKNADAYAVKASLPRYYNGGDIYIEHRFSNDVGLSLGWEQSDKATMNYVFYANQIFIDGTQHAGDNSIITNKLRVVHADLTGYYNFSPNFEAVGQLGLELMQAFMTGIVYTGKTSYNLQPGHNYQLIPRIGFCLQYFLINNWGVRGALGWEGTNLYRMKVTNADGIRGTIKPFCQSATATIGIIARFM